MSNVINKKTLRYLESVNTPDYPEEDWIINPVLPKCEKKYWKIVSGKVAEMTQLQKDAVDANLVKQEKVNEAESIIQQKIREVAIEKGVVDGVLNVDGTLKE